MNHSSFFLWLEAKTIMQFRNIGRVFSCLTLLTGCANNPNNGHEQYTLNSIEQLRKAEFVGQDVRFCPMQSKPCRYEEMREGLVTSKDKNGFTLAGGETFLYKDVDLLSYDVPRAVEAQDNAIRSLTNLLSILH